MSPGLAIALALPVFWVFLCYSMSMLGGWWQLGRHYRCREPFTGPRLHVCTLRFGSYLLSTNYLLIITTGGNAEGLYLAVFFPFRLGHPPLFIPWADIRAEMTHGLIFSWLRLEFDKAPGVVARMPEDVARHVARFANRSWADAGGGVK